MTCVALSVRVKSHVLWECLGHIYRVATVTYYTARENASQILTSSVALRKHVIF